MAVKNGHEWVLPDNKTGEWVVAVVAVVVGVFVAEIIERLLTKNEVVKENQKSNS